MKTDKNCHYERKIVFSCQFFLVCNNSTRLTRALILVSVPKMAWFCSPVTNKETKGPDEERKTERQLSKNGRIRSSRQGRTLLACYFSLFKASMNCSKLSWICLTRSEKDKKKPTSITTKPLRQRKNLYQYTRSILRTQTLVTIIFASEILSYVFYS